MELFENVLYDFPQQGRILTSKPLEIPGLEGERALSLYLPPHYEEQGSQFYELAYLFDGENLYNGQRLGLDQTSQTWQLHRLLDKRANLKLPTPIVVGIQHGPSREAELSPWPDHADHTHHTSARGESLLDWIEQELHPQLIEQLPLLEGPEHTLLAGAFHGGLLALYACLSRPAHFGRAMALSPSLSVQQGALADFVSQLEPQTLQALRLYLDSSEPEASDLVAGFKAKGLMPKNQLGWLRASDQLSWSRRLSLGFDYFYGAGVLNLTSEFQLAA